MRVKPCPFCGERPEVSRWSSGYAAGHNDATAIQCSSDLYDCPVQPIISAYTKDEALAAWNMRMGMHDE